MKRRRPEHDFQCEVIDYLNAFGRRELEWGAIANGELRHPTVAMRLKAEGVRPGFSDIVILLDHSRTAWLELKAKRGRLSDEQIGFGRKATRLGHYWACAKTMDEAVAAFKAWGVLRPEGTGPSWKD